MANGKPRNTREAVLVLIQRFDDFERDFRHQHISKRLRVLEHWRTTITAGFAVIIGILFYFKGKVGDAAAAIVKISTGQ